MYIVDLLHNLNCEDHKAESCDDIKSSSEVRRNIISKISTYLIASLLFQMYV